MRKPTTITKKRPILQISMPEGEKIKLEQRSSNLGMSASDFGRTVLNMYSDTYYRSQKSTPKK
jgi:hypothetical protein